MLLPTSELPDAAMLTAVPEILTLGLRGERVVVAMEKVVGLGVRVEGWAEVIG